MKKIIVSILMFLVCTGAVFSQDSSYHQNLAKKYISEVIFAAMESCKEDKSDGILTKPEESGMVFFRKQFYKADVWEYEDIKNCLNKGNGWETLSTKVFEVWKEDLVNNKFSSQGALTRLIKQEVVCPYNAGKISGFFDKKLDKIQSSYLKIVNEKAGDNNSNSSVEVACGSGEVVSLEKKRDVSPSRLQVQRKSSLDFLHYLLILVVGALSFLCVRIWLKLKEYKKGKEYYQRKFDDLQTPKKSQRAKENSGTKSNSSRNKAVNDQTEIKVSQVQQNRTSLADSELGKPKTNSSDKNNERFAPQYQNSNSDSQPAQQNKAWENGDLQVNETSRYVSQNLYFEEFIEGAFVVRSASKQKSAWSVYKITTLTEKEGRLELLHQEMGQEIIINKEMYLSDSICDVTYQSGGNISRVVNTVAGKVRLNGNNWEVVEKVKVVIV